MTIKYMLDFMRNGIQNAEEFGYSEQIEGWLRSFGIIMERKAYGIRFTVEGVEGISATTGLDGITEYDFRCVGVKERFYEGILREISTSKELKMLDWKISCYGRYIE